MGNAPSDEREDGVLPCTRRTLLGGLAAVACWAPLAALAEPASAAARAPLLVTGGNLVFAGGTNDRAFRAFDARTGEVLWQQRTSSGVVGVPTTYEVDGVQYVAVLSGWGVDAERIQQALNYKLPESEHVTVPQGGVLWVFALGK